MAETSSDKLDRVIELLNKALTPMACVLKEIRASNRSRWIVLLSLAAMMVVVGGASFSLLDRLSKLTNQLEELQSEFFIRSVQLDTLINVSARHAGSRQVKGQLEDLRRLSPSVSEDVIRAAAQAAPDIVLQEAKKLQEQPQLQE